MKRNRRCDVEDLWQKTVYGDDGKSRTVASAREGRGKRWRACYVDDAGHERTQAFDRKTDAQAWLNEISAKLTTGTYVAPKAGRVTVAAVYASWPASQGHISPKTAATRKSAWNSRVQPQWGDVAVVDVKTAAVRAWAAKMKADGVGVPGIENAFGLLR